MQAALGIANSLDGFEAGARSARQALRELGRARPAFGILVSDQAYPIDQVTAGAVSALGETPLWGFSTSAGLHLGGQAHHSVMIALLSGEGLAAWAAWQPGFIENSRLCTQELLNTLQPPTAAGSALLLAAEGLNGDASEACAALPSGAYGLAGGLSGGYLHGGRTSQVGGHQSGSGGLAAATLEGVCLGVGAAHGWKPTGAYARITQARGYWVRTLDDQPSVDTYARYFGFASRDWAFPPLNELVRAYPLGLEARNEERASLLVRAPLRVELDGSLRMNTSLPEGSLAHLMVASTESCLEAARRAAQQALAGLNGARPALALALVDSAWQIVLQAQPGSEAAALKAVLGSDLPLIGGYTYGQLSRPEGQGPAELLNNHILVALFAAPANP